MIEPMTGDHYPDNWVKVRWQSDYGNYTVGKAPYNDCMPGPNGVPRLKELCLFKSNDTGHFVFEGQAKRCVSLTINSNYIDECQCLHYTWEEVSCTAPHKPATTLALGQAMKQPWLQPGF